MRLIDADALIPMMKYATTDSEIGVFPIKIGFNAIIEVINNAPTIDAVPAKRGEWIETDEWDEFCGRLYKCSNCKTFVLGYFDNYCPYCGADMRGN